MRQLLGVWAAGSLTLGTVALIFVLNRTGDVVLRPVVDLGMAAWLVLLLVAVLVVALAMLSPGAGSWLTEHARGRALWTLVVLVGGLAGWGYAATVALVLQWSPTPLVVLAYVGGGLPFALAAAALARSGRLAASALGTGVVLLVLGAVLVAKPGSGPFVIVQECVSSLLLLLVSPVALPL